MRVDTHHRSIDTMAKRGPAPRYKPDFCPIAYKFCLLGATNDDLAGLFEVSRATVGNWLARYPDFKQAVHQERLGHVGVGNIAALAISRPIPRPPSSGCATGAASNGAR
jgi:hypothetical protein